MAYIDLSEFNDLASDGGYAGYKELSDTTVLLCLTFLLNAENENNWRGAGYSLTPAEIDEIDGIVAGAQAELMTNTGGTPTGAIICTAWATAQDGYLLCDGATYDKGDYPELYDAIDTTFHVGGDEFTVPDIRGRVVGGAGQGSGLTNRAMNGIDGSENVTLTESEIPAHNHGIVQGQPLLRVYAPATGTLQPPSPPYVDDNANFDTISGLSDVIGWDSTDSAGSGDEHDNMQPSIFLRWYIKT